MADKQYLTFTDDIIKAADRWKEIDKAERSDLNFEAFLKLKCSELNLDKKLFARIDGHSADRLALLMSPYYVAFIKMWLTKHADDQN